MKKVLFSVRNLFKPQLCCAALLLAISHSAFADVPVNDSNIEYVGRWDKSNGSTYHSYWGGTYLRVRFTGTTVAVKQAAAVDFWADIDGTGYNYFTGAVGSVNMTPSPLASGTHVLTVAVAWEGKELQFQGLTLSNGGATLAPAFANKPLIEFIGDSITCGLYTAKEQPTAYGWLVSEQLNCNHTQISCSGITLVDGYHYSNNNLRGQSYQYFIEQEPNSPVTPDVNWNFANYTARLVVINLGSNDGLQTPPVPSATFQSTYITFMQNIRAKYPNTTIIALRPFAGYYATEIQNAVNQRYGSGDQNVRYIDTTGWISSSDTKDGLHPNDAGHRKIANYLAPILSAYVPSAAVPLQGNTYGILNVKSGLAMDSWGGGLGVSPHQYNYYGGANQRWYLWLDYNNWFISSANSVLEDSGWGLTNGTAVVQNALNYYYNQQWTATPAGDGSFTIKNANSGLAMEVAGGSMSSGAVIDQWEDWGGSNQHWKLIQILISGRKYRITNVGTGKPLDSYGGASSPTLHQWTEYGGTNQQWTLTQLTNGYWAVASDGNTVIDDVSWGSTNGAPVGLYTYGGGSNQQWNIVQNSDGSFTIQNVYSTMALEIPGRSTADGALVNQWYDFGYDYQRWTFYQLN